MNHRNCKNDCVLAWKSDIAEFFRRYRVTAPFGLLFGTVLYSMMMSQQLTNTFDGLWQQNYHIAARGELTSGRWMLIVVDKLIKGLHADPIASIAALILFVAGFLLVLDLLEIKNNFCSCLCIALFLSSTAISNTLSYRFTSQGYGLAYLLAALSVYAIVKIKSPFIAVPVSGVLLGLSMACYQAYLGVFCIVAVFYIIFLCGKAEKPEEKSNNIIFNLLRMGCALCVGAAFYVLSLSFFLKWCHASLSGYNGIDGVSFGGLLAGLPQSVLKTHRYFGAYFWGDELKINSLQPFGASYLLLVLLAVLFILAVIRIWKVKKQRIIILALAMPAIPVACSAYMLIAGDKLELQMTAGLAMLMPLTIIAVFSYFDGKRFLQSICMLLCVLLLYGNSMQVWIDQEAMYEGRNASVTMATQVISDLKNHDLLLPDYEYFFVGVPEENPLFSVNDIYYCANGYAQMGNFWVSGNCSQRSYSGLINKYMGFDLPMSPLKYENVAKKINASEMPEFPHDGYITLLDDHTVVIKISEYKEYAGHSKYVID